MAYQFDTRPTGSVNATMTGSTDATKNLMTFGGINARETDATIIMGGLSILSDIASFSVREATRTIKQDVTEGE